MTREIKLMKPITVYQCQYCKKLFRRQFTHKCKFNPRLKNCFTCKHSMGWSDFQNDGYSTRPYPLCDVESDSSECNIDEIKAKKYLMDCDQWEEGEGIDEQTKSNR